MTTAASHTSTARKATTTKRVGLDYHIDLGDGYYYSAPYIGRADGRYAKIMRQCAKTDVLIMDEWGLAVLTDQHRRDLLEILDDRYNMRATIITSQLPVAHWHEAIGDPTLADAILDRVVHNAYKINLSGKTMRKDLEKLTTERTKI